MNLRKRNRDLSVNNPSESVENKKQRKTSKSSDDLPNLGVDENIIKDWEQNFIQNPMNRLAKNAVTTVGSYLSSLDPDQTRQVTHLFMNTIKQNDLKSTNQGRSGRCWLFAGMNTFRHFLVKAMHLKDFEFSETYLFFWDKLERANTFMQWFIDHNYRTDSREVQYMLSEYRGDGGYWEMFANLVHKYGLVPSQAMPETYQSSDSDDMNDILINKQNAFANWVMNHRKLDRQGRLLNEAELTQEKMEVLHQLYDTLVKFLGQPPKDFTWFYSHLDDEHEYVASAMTTTASDFTNMVIPKPSFDVRDFVSLGNYPAQDCQYNKIYEIKWTSNMHNGTNARFLNLPIQDLKDYAKKSIAKGIPVWFAGDVRRGFDFFHSALNLKVFNNDLLFGETKSMDKGERLNVRDSAACHAMVLVGFNLDEKDNTKNWQVENSWGYYDNEVPGLDGFLSMSDEWFDECVFEVVIHKNLLSRSHSRLLSQEPHILNPWDSMAPATRVGPVYAPANYLTNLGKNKHKFLTH